MAGVRKQENAVLAAARREEYSVVKAALVELKNKTRARRISLCEDSVVDSQVDLLADDCGNAGTLLHYAALWGWTDVITYVIESEGLNVNLTNKKSGKTPFMLAVENKQLLAALLLLILGADPLAKNNNGYTALHYAIMCDDEQTVRFTHWVMKRSVKHESCSKMYPSLAAYLCSPLSGGEQTVCPKSPTDICDPLDSENDVNVTALMVAVAYGRLRTTKELLSLGASVKRCDADGNTVLILVSQMCKVEQCKVNWLNRENYNAYDEEIMSMLLDHGADPNISNFKGRTALHYAVIFRRMNLIQILLRAGASVTIRDTDGASARDLAVRSEDEALRGFMCMSLSKIIRVIGKMAPFPRPQANCAMCNHQPVFNPASTCPFQGESSPMSPDCPPRPAVDNCNSLSQSPPPVQQRPQYGSPDQCLMEPFCPPLIASAPPECPVMERNCPSPGISYRCSDVERTCAGNIPKEPPGSYTACHNRKRSSGHTVRIDPAPLYPACDPIPTVRASKPCFPCCITGGGVKLSKKANKCSKNKGRKGSRQVITPACGTKKTSKSKVDNKNKSLKCCSSSEISSCASV